MQVVESLAAWDATKFKLISALETRMIGTLVLKGEINDNNAHDKP